MMKALSVTMCLMLPMAAFAEDAVVVPAPEAAPLVQADQPTAANLTPVDAAPAPDATKAQWGCGMHGGCHGKGGGKAKFIVIGGVIGTVLTAAAVGLAVGVASQNQNQGSVR